MDGRQQQTQRRGGGRGGRGDRGGRGGPRVAAPQHSRHAATQAMEVDSMAPSPSASTPELVRPLPTVTSHLSNVTFASLSSHNVDQRLLDAIPFSLMSEVQAATIEPALQGVDILAQAKTGTGKTVAFLLPAIQRILTSGSPARGSISCLILSPTRELALQIEKEANLLLARIDSSVLGVQHVVGGTNMSSEVRQLNSKRCDILVATPGRLLDHLQTTPGFPARLNQLRTYILDEADRMLDMGFRQELQKIAVHLPDRKQVPRQLLLFSATIPPGVREVAGLDPKNARFINTLSEEESNTHAHVSQESVVVDSWADALPATLALILEEIARLPLAAKVIVFSPTARAAGLAAELFRTPAVTRRLETAANGSFPIGEIHSRKSQSARVKATSDFAAAPRAVLFSSDVAARGVDFPGVSCVLQVGLPASGEQYVHRIGRTGRAGAEGKGAIVLARNGEERFLGLPEMRDLPIRQRPQLALDEARKVVHAGLLAVSDETKSQAYQAALGYFKGELKLLRWGVPELIARVNEYAQHALMYRGGQSDQPPPLQAKTVGKMGLKGVQGLNVVRGESQPQQQGRGGSGGGHQVNGGGGGARGGGARGGRGGGRGRGGARA